MDENAKKAILSLPEHHYALYMLGNAATGAFHAARAEASRGNKGDIEAFNNFIMVIAKYDQTSCDEILNWIERGIL